MAFIFQSKSGMLGGSAAMANSCLISYGECVRSENADLTVFTLDVNLGDAHARRSFGEVLDLVLIYT